MKSRDRRKKRRRQQPAGFAAEPSPYHLLSAPIVLAFSLGAMAGYMMAWTVLGGVFFIIAMFFAVLAVGRLIGYHLAKERAARRAASATERDASLAQRLSQER